MFVTLFSHFNRSDKCSLLPNTPDTGDEKNLPWKKTLLYTCILTIVLFATTFLLLPDSNADYREFLLVKMKQADTFEEFSNALFCYEITTDSVTTAYTLKSPSTYNIPSLTPTLTSFSYETYLKESTNVTSSANTIIQKQLKHFSKESLSKEEQLTLTCLKDYTDTGIALSQYPFYEYLLGSSSGVQTNLPITLGEYPFRSKEDVETYLSLLETDSILFSKCHCL